MIKAKLRNKNGVVFICAANPALKIMDKINDFIFKQKILLGEIEISASEALKAADIGFTIKVINPDWEDDENTLIMHRDYVDGKLIVYENGEKTDEYLPLDFITPKMRFFLDGVVDESGEYIPF